MFVVRATRFLISWEHNNLNLLHSNIEMWKFEGDLLTSKLYIERSICVLWRCSNEKTTEWIFLNQCKCARPPIELGVSYAKFVLVSFMSCNLKSTSERLFNLSQFNSYFSFVLTLHLTLCTQCVGIIRVGDDGLCKRKYHMFA